MKKALYIAFLVILSTAAVAQQAERTVPADNDRQAGVDNDGPSYWNEGLKIVSYRLPPPPVGYQPEFKELDGDGDPDRSEAHTSELQSLMRTSYAVFCLKKKTTTQ